jgi:hypothetical protein
MTLADLRRLSVKRQTRIHFRLNNGMECIVSEHGIAQVPDLHAIPDFNLEQELTSAQEFVLEPVGDSSKKSAPQRKQVSRDELSALLTSAAAPGAVHDHEEE